MIDAAPIFSVPGFAPSPLWREGWGEGLAGRRVNELAALFREIEQTRMAGLPVLNRALRVEAIGFEPLDESAPAPASAPPPARSQPVEVLAPGHSAATVSHPAPPNAIGILLTPWFMNLVLLPLSRVDAVPPADTRHIHLIGSTRFEFIASHEPAIGAFDACSLFSPVFEFPDQASAVATARAVLMSLRAQQATLHAASSAQLAEHKPQPAATDAPPARRAFFRALASGRRAPAP